MASTDKLVTLFVPVYANVHATEELARQIHSRSAEWLDIQVVANGSPAPVLAALKRSGIRFLQVPHNRGYGGAIQSSITLADTSYVAWMPGNLKISVADFESCVSPLMADGTRSFRAGKGLRRGRSYSDLWKTRILSTTQSILSRTALPDGGAPPTIVARDLVPMLADGPRDYGYDHWVLWRLIGSNVPVRRFPIRYIPHPSVPSTWNKGLGASWRMFVHLNRQALEWRR